MSIELANATDILGQFASNGGYSDLIAASKDDSVLKTFFQHGCTEDVPTVVKALKSLDAPHDVLETVFSLCKLMEGQDLVIITDGTSNGGVEKDSPTVNAVHVPRPLGSSSKPKKPKSKDDPGTQDVNPPEDSELPLQKFDISAALFEHLIAKAGDVTLDEELVAKEDKITVDVPLFIRLLELAREDIKTDPPIHEVTEKITELMNGKDCLGMDDYEKIVSVLNGGQPAAKVSKRISGNSDISLNAKGEKLADELGKRIAIRGGLNVGFSSPLPRAVQTLMEIKERCPEMHIADPPLPGLCPWHLGEYEGRMPHDVHALIDGYISHPDEVPPGKCADGTLAESFNAAKKRQIDCLRKIYEDWAEQDPTMKVGVIMHSRGMELLQSWVDEGCPDDYELKIEDLIHPDDPDHACVLRWHKDKIKPVDLDEDDPLKPGVYLILHSLTDDDTDEGNPELKTGKVSKYLAPLEVHQAAKAAYDAGVVVLDITAPLAKSEGLGLDQIQKIAEHFADAAAATEPKTTRDAWGGRYAAKWASRVFKKVTQDREYQEVAKAGSGVMVALWPDPKVAEKIAVEDGEPADALHVTLAYFGKLDEFGADKLPFLEAALEHFASTHSPISIQLSGLGRFPATPSSDGKDVAYLGVHSPEIQQFRQELVDAVKGLGCDPKANFGYNPHMTLKYVAPHAPHLLPTPDARNLAFEEIVLSVGADKKVYRLGVPLSEVTKADWEISGEIIKVDQDRHLVFGWFSIVSVGGKPFADTQGDIITPDTIENSAYEFVLNARTGGEMHRSDSDGDVKGVGRLVESVVFTTEKQAAMLQSLHDQGIKAELDLGCVAWWGGMFIDSPEVWDRVKAGKLRAWSIGGKGKRAAI